MLSLLFESVNTLPDAGKAPRGWQPDTEQQAAVAVQQVKRSGGGMRCVLAAALR
jgi:hypothetical protein